MKMERWLRGQLGEQMLTHVDSRGQRTDAVLHLRYLGNAAASGARQICVTVQDTEIGSAALNALWQLWVPVLQPELQRPGASMWRYCKCRWMHD